MDLTDIKIINILETEGRISIKELGQKVALSSPAVTERIKRLEDSRIIQGYKAIISTEELGYNINFFIHVAINVSKQKSFLEFANNNDNIVECHHVTGAYSMILKARLDNMSSLESLLGKIQAFGNTETHVIMSTPIAGKNVFPSEASMKL